MWREPDAITSIQEVTWTNTPDDEGFFDLKFPADHTSLGEEWLEAQPRYQSEGSVEWIRAPDLNRDEPDDLFGEIKPDEMLQGGVGDCWLIAAIACVAEFPNQIKGLFKDDSVSTDGRYIVKLYDVQKGAWTEIEVDDFIPCEKRWFWQRLASPLFSKQNGNLLWPMLLEKAFAKFCRAYGKLDGGSTSWAWQAMTGCEKQHMYTKEEDATWLKTSIGVEQQKKAMENGERRACPYFQDMQAPLSTQALWEVLKKADAANYLMSASIHAGHEREHKREDGLVEGHAYSLISAVDEDSFRLVKLRNPWGQQEWNGPWSDSAGEWDEHPEIEKKLQPCSQADGCFWMDFDDFCQNFSSVFVCPQRMSEEKIGKVPQPVDEDDEKFDAIRKPEGFNDGEPKTRGLNSGARKRTRGANLHRKGELTLKGCGAAGCGLSCAVM
eukprot:gnl/TRDRNA2_/TRDRNA2_75769_c1_seq1.p1 gnl/TRDRNA2_/TRDRNA2_75769_c1~~gnl/TRDRNA2_/TRDRNA2_75769_c1_seq1.p1  ORF type:complete len:445 (+),score=72.42 gnl/TRDRNA2_/TRDRNA2_75769_c1_seq1:24-1337(+)